MLLADLEKRIRSWNVESCLGDLFIAMGDYLRVATQYVNNYETAFSTISSELKVKEKICVGRFNVTLSCYIRRMQGSKLSMKK